MNTMSIDYGKKLKEIRKAENMTQIEFAKLLKIGLATIRHYETGVKGVGLVVISKVINHPKFNKYTMWLLTDKVIYEAGQIEPASFLSRKEIKMKDDRKNIAIFR